MGGFKSLLLRQIPKSLPVKTSGFFIPANLWYNSIGASDVDDLIFGSDDQVIYSER